MNVVGDGNCLFYALSTAMTGGPKLAHELRCRAAHYMMNHSEEFSIFEHDDDFEILKEIERTWTLKVWGGPPQIFALAQVVQRDIIVLQAQFLPTLAGQTVLESFKKAKGLHSIYKATSPRDDKTYVLLFTAMGKPSKKAELIHFVPLLPLPNKRVPWDLFSRITNVYKQERRRGGRR